MHGHRVHAKILESLEELVDASNPLLNEIARLRRDKKKVKAGYG